MKHAALIAALFLIGCAERLPTTSIDILWQIRSPEEISSEGARHGHKRADGLAWYRAEPCRIMTAWPDRRTLEVIVHELRHCIEGAFHE